MVPASRGEVSSPGRLDSRLIHRDNGSVSVSHQVGVQVEGSGKTVVGHSDSGHRSGVVSSGDGGDSMVSVATVSNATVSVATVATAGSEVIGASSRHSGLVSRHHGAVSVGHKVGVQVQGAGVANVGVGDRSDGSVVDSGSVGDGRDSGVSSVSSGVSGVTPGVGVVITVHSVSSVLDGQSGEVVGPGGLDGGLVHWHHGAVRVRHQAVERKAGGSGHAGGENLEIIMGLPICRFKHPKC